MCYRFKTDLASKYKHKPALQVMFNEQPFEVFSEIDFDADGLISYEETVRFFRTIHTNESFPLNEIKRQFQEEDTNRDGYIQTGEFDRQLLRLQNALP